MILIRTFSAKCTPQALDYLDTHINDWVKETNPTIKMTNQSFGSVEGKGGQRDPQLFVSVWYEPAE